MSRRIAAVATWWFFALACSDGSGPPSSGVSAAQACADNAHARCTQLESCSPTDVLLRYGSEGTCETREAENCTTALAEPLNGNTPDALEACAGAYAGWACAEYLSDENIPKACRQQLGPIVDGGSCAIDGQCESGFCGIVPGSACGTCAAVPKVGASCAELTACGPGQACTADTFACVLFGARGAACGRGSLCGVGLSCVGADPGAQGTCEQAGEEVGTACDPTSKAHSACDRNAGLVCNTGTESADGGADDDGGAEAGTEAGAEEAGIPPRTCQQVIIAAAGQPCGNDLGGQPVYCQAGGVCTGANGTTPGVCTAAAADGAPCDTINGPTCATPARCIGDGGTTGTCQYSGAQSCR
ncbi:MAG TPA: hypothetical protein VGL81_28335 [Polyangiaceae bacterium]|jgi:hypothetical protein